MLCAAAFADTVTIVSGTNTNGNSQVIVSGNYSAVLDNNWKAVFLGNYDLGSTTGRAADSPPPSSLISTRDGLETLLAKDEVKDKLANMRNAFVYTENIFPLTNTVWSGIENTLGAKWIGSVDGAEYKKDSWGPDWRLNHETGYYAFQVSFNADDAFRYLTGYAATDNMLLGIMLNGTLLDDKYWEFFLDPMKAGTVYDEESYRFWLTGKDVLRNGENTLTFLIANYAQYDYGNPVGLVLYGEQTNIFPRWAKKTDPAPTPEPATLAVFGLGIAGLAALRRRKR